MPKRALYFLWISLLLVATACTSAPTFSSQPGMPSPTPIMVSRWKLYEAALSEEIMWAPSICEWTILGSTKREVYVWALCYTIDMYASAHSAASVPAVIYLDAQGQIVRVAIPGDGTQYSIDIRKLFPPDLQKKVLSQEDLGFDLKAAEKHLEQRLLDPALPPLIVDAGTLLP